MFINVNPSTPKFHITRYLVEYHDLMTSGLAVYIPPPPPIPPFPQLVSFIKHASRLTSLSFRNSSHYNSSHRWLIYSHLLSRLVRHPDNSVSLFLSFSLSLSFSICYPRAVSSFLLIVVHPHLVHVLPFRMFSPISRNASSVHRAN